MSPLQSTMAVPPLELLTATVVVTEELVGPTDVVGAPLVVVDCDPVVWTVDVGEPEVVVAGAPPLLFPP